MIFEEGIVDDEEEFDYDEDEFIEEAVNGMEEKVDEEGIIFEEDRHQTKLKLFFKLSKISKY